ncbi:Gfo/Idh/MocA family oxidoreductase [Litorilinea aerophila]|uniref:Gfo/Idh/MocA family oxidoreductase n=1 Tax=Litorilinea aerophila TaxID=1204385 RepID=A0A540VJ08_9CHLR|nr:Gfo/Idh/MocA family oxidoreductase [Litorilinea aerophila]MCC9075596.1 Gfo/Idh/MocA family oxidoreductase [Litorilinea aerophila]
MKTIRWGIIGCGDVTEVKSGPGFQKARNSALVAVMRRNGDLARDYAQRHNVPKWYDDAEALIRDPDVDAVYIATPPYAHKQYTLMAAAAGKPVYVEKPMAMNYQECQEMIQACEEAGVPLWVAYYRRMLPRFLKIKTLLEEGAIGEPRFVTVTLTRPVGLQFRNPGAQGAEMPWRVDPAIAGGGLFVDLGSHILDYLDYFLGPVTQACGHAANQAGHYPAEDVVTGSFVFQSGVHGVGVWNFASYTAVDQTEIVGSKGKLTFSSFGTEPVRLTTEKGTSEFDIETPRHVQQPLIQTIVDELNGQGKCPSTGVSAARTNWVMDQLLRDYYRKG